MFDLLSNLIIDRIYMVTTMYNDAGSGMKRIGRERWALVLKYEGETVYKTADAEYISNSQSLMLLPRKSSYEWRCTSPGNYITIEFDSPSSFEGIFNFHIQSTDEIFKMFKQMEYKWLKKKGFYMLETVRDLYTLILKLASMQKSEYVPSLKSEKLSPAVDHMLTHYTEHMTNDGLAELCGISTVYFRKLFTDTYGKAPMEYVKGLRIKRAREMLCGDYGSISDVATSLGYTSIYDFSRDFKKRVGVSPSKYNLKSKQTGA